MTRSALIQLVSPVLSSSPKVKSWLIEAETRFDVLRHSAANIVPQLIRPDPRLVFITLTAACNQRCVGCRYGRDFTLGHQLSWPMVRDLLDDVKALGLYGVRLYGGEPLLHKDLPRIIEYSLGLGLKTWITTNGILLERRIDELYDAGLRTISIGFYGLGADFDNYVQREGNFAKLEQSIDHVRNRYGEDVSLDLSWLLMRPTCSLDGLHRTWEFAKKYSMPIGVNLIHYSLPYFTEGPERELQFRSTDREAIVKVVEELVRLKQMQPEMIHQTIAGLRSIPDWLLKGAEMRVPCERYRLIWIGADGRVQMCYVTFELGNLHQARLKDLLFTADHRRAARDAFKLNCPNCHCGYDQRVRLHASSRRKYGADA